MLNVMVRTDGQHSFLGKAYFDHCPVQHLCLATAHCSFGSIALDKVNKRIITDFLDAFDLAVLSEVSSIVYRLTTWLMISVSALIL